MKTQAKSVNSEQTSSFTRRRKADDKVAELRRAHAIEIERAKRPPVNSDRRMMSVDS